MPRYYPTIPSCVLVFYYETKFVCIGSCSKNIKISAENSSDSLGKTRLKYEVTLFNRTKSVGHLVQNVR